MIQKSIIVLAALILALSPPTLAQNQSTKVSRPPVQTAIRAARLLDVKTGALITFEFTGLRGYSRRPVE